MTYTLVSDGPTDANLIPIINWTLKEVARVQIANGTRAEFWRLEEPPRSLAEKLVKAIELFPCETLFVHRDAEREEPAVRNKEIQTAYELIANSTASIPAVTIVPVRMLEA